MADFRSRYYLAWWSWSLTFRPLNGVTGHPCHGLTSCQFFSFLYPSVPNLSQGRDRWTDHLYYAATLWWWGHYNSLQCCHVWQLSSNTNLNMDGACFCIEICDYIITVLYDYDVVAFGDYVHTCSIKQIVSSSHVYIPLALYAWSAKLWAVWQSVLRNMCHDFGTDFSELWQLWNQFICCYSASFTKLQNLLLLILMVLYHLSAVAFLQLCLMHKLMHSVLYQYQFGFRTKQ